MQHYFVRAHTVPPFTQRLIVPDKWYKLTKTVATRGGILIGGYIQTEEGWPLEICPTNCPNLWGQPWEIKPLQTIQGGLQ